MQLGSRITLASARGQERSLAVAVVLLLLSLLLVVVVERLRNRIIEQHAHFELLLGPGRSSSSLLARPGESSLGTRPHRCSFDRWKELLAL